MSQNLYHELKNIGINEELAAKVSASLDPEYNASKKDILIMQEAIMQVQLKSDARYHDLNNRFERNYHELNSKIDRSYHDLSSKIDQVNNRVDKVSSDLCVEIAAISRQFWITFGGLITTILSVFAVNWYFH